MATKLPEGRDEKGHFMSGHSGFGGGVDHGYIFSEERNKKISESNRGKEKSIEHRKHISEALKGVKKSKEHIRKSVLGRKGFKHTPESREKIGQATLSRVFSEEKKREIGKKISDSKIGIKHGHIHTEEFKKKLSDLMRGRKVSIETRRKMSIARKGENSSNWKGGVTPLNKRTRHSIELRLWREAVFARDNWTCQECGKRGGTLNAHHLVEFSKNKELRTSIENGKTLCVSCHRKIHFK